MQAGEEHAVLAVLRKLKTFWNCIYLDFHFLVKYWNIAIYIENNQTSQSGLEDVIQETYVCTYGGLSLINSSDSTFFSIQKSCSI